MANENQIRRNGWRQGSVVASELAETIAAETSSPDGAVFIVASQDCDVVHGSLDAEPKVEVIAALKSPDAEPDPQLAHGKNPRRLHLRFGEGDRLEFAIKDRYFVDRALLVDHQPAERLDETDTRLIANWIAKRYVRSAFPDAFNDRITGAARKIDKALKAHGEGASGIFLILDHWDEVDDAVPYNVVIVVTCPVAVAEDESREAEVAALASKLMTALDACKGINVLDAQHVAENDFTLDDLHTHKRWEFDFRSHSGRPGGSISPKP